MFAEQIKRKEPNKETLPNFLKFLSNALHVTIPYTFLASGPYNLSAYSFSRLYPSCTASLSLEHKKNYLRLWLELIKKEPAQLFPRI